MSQMTAEIDSVKRPSDRGADTNSVMPRPEELLAIQLERHDGQLTENSLGLIADSLKQASGSIDHAQLLSGMSGSERMALLPHLSGYENRSELVKSIALLEGFDPRLFLRAYSHASYAELKGEEFGKFFNAAYSAFDHSQRSANSDVLRTRIAENVAAGVTFDTDRLAQYELRGCLTASIRAYRGYPNKNFENVDSDWGNRLMPYMDCPCGLVLTFKGIENAIVTFFPKKDDPGCLMISQIQGVRKAVEVDGGIKKLHSRGLNELDWRKVLVEYVETMAKAAGFERVGILSAHNNYWCHSDGEGKVHVPLKEGLKRYDELAERLGYIKEPVEESWQFGNWFKELR